MIVCSGVLMGWYGADVTPWIFYENFIELMVTIDAVNGGERACSGRRSDESVVSVDSIAGNADAFASRLAPTGFCSGHSGRGVSGK